jgi:hypothetical protein
MLDREAVVGSMRTALSPHLVQARGRVGRGEARGALHETGETFVRVAAGALGKVVVEVSP